MEFALRHRHRSVLACGCSENYLCASRWQVRIAGRACLAHQLLASAIHGPAQPMQRPGSSQQKGGGGRCMLFSWEIGVLEGGPQPAGRWWRPLTATVLGNWSVGEDRTDQEAEVAGQQLVQVGECRHQLQGTQVRHARERESWVQRAQDAFEPPPPRCACSRSRVCAFVHKEHGGEHGRRARARTTPAAAIAPARSEAATAA